MLDARAYPYRFPSDGAGASGGPLGRDQHRHLLDRRAFEDHVSRQLRQPGGERAHAQRQSAKRAHDRRSGRQERGGRDRHLCRAQAARLQCRLPEGGKAADDDPHVQHRGRGLSSAGRRTGRVVRQHRHHRRRNRSTHGLRLADQRHRRRADRLRIPRQGAGHGLRRRADRNEDSRCGFVSRAGSPSW